MHIPWYFFAFATPFLYGLTNQTEKFLLEKQIRDPLLITMLAGLATGVFGIVLLFFTGVGTLAFWQMGLLFVAGLLLIFYLLPYFEALRREDASRIVPLYQFIPVMTLLLSAVLLKETLAAKQIAGLVLIVAAGIFIAGQPEKGKIFSLRPALWFMLLSCLMYGWVGILFRLTARGVPFWNALAYEYIGTGCGGLLLLSLPRVRKLFVFQSQRKNRTSIFSLMMANNGLGLLAEMCEAYAVTLVAVPLVNLATSVQPFLVLLFGVILSRYFPHIVREDIRKEVIAHKLLAMCVILIGLYFVYF